MIRLVAMAVGVCVLHSAVASEAPLSPESYYVETQRARQLFESKQYSEALPLIEKLTARYGDDSMGWLAKTIAANATGQYDAAIDAGQRALALGVINERHAWFEVAKAYASQGKRTAALDAIENALAERLTPRTHIRDERAFAAFKEDERFRRMAGLLPARSFSREEGWRYDLAFMIEEARRVHASFSREAFSPGFEAAARSLHDEIPKLSDAQIRARMHRMLALLRDGHTGIDIDYRTHRLPLRLYFFPDGVFVIDAADPHKQLIGNRVLRIGDRSIEELLADLPPYVPRDNSVGVQWRGPHTLVHLDFLQALGATQSSNRVALTVKKGNAAERRVELDVIAAGDPEFVGLHTSTQRGDSTPLYLQRSPQPYWTRRLSPQTLYFHFGGVWEVPEQGIKAFATALHRDLNDGTTRNVIVDVRLNAGGNLTLYSPILQALGAFRIGSPEREIYCITSRNTFSAAQAFIGDLERWVLPVFVGEPSGSSPNFVGESPGWTDMPYSGTRFSISNRHHQHAALPDDGRAWIAPQVPVELTSADFFAGKDPSLEAVLRAIAMRD